jgi:hypothetical protein
LRQEAIKLVVVFTQRIGKPEVKKELTIGDVIKSGLADPEFVILILGDEIAFSDAPPEFICGNILNAHPNWHDCLAELLEALADERVPREAQPDTVALQAVVEAREDGNATGA